MGKARSYEIIEYRNIIRDIICKTPELVKLLGCEKEEHPEDIIPFKYSFPHEYVPGTVTRTERFVNYDIEASLDYKNNVFKNLTIYFYIMAHEDVVKYRENGRTYLWYDKVVCELDNIFSFKNVLGVGYTRLISNDIYSPKYEFKGRLLSFVVKDFNNGLKYGK